MRSNNKITIALTCIFLTLLISLLFLFRSGYHQTRKRTNQESLPLFGLYDLKGNIISTSDVDKGFVLFLFYDPSCETCRDELIKININRERFQNGQIIFLSTQSKNDIETFLQTINFQVLSNMHFLIDPKGILIEKMDINHIPCAFIYKDGKLFKKFEGYVKVETLIKYMG